MEGFGIVFSSSSPFFFQIVINSKTFLGFLDLFASLESTVDVVVKLSTRLALACLLFSTKIFSFDSLSCFYF